ncbi:uncharacterized protein ATC70_009957 [Mucor velutinosus]|uniref:Uncharacterized protein n=1 Tax=Mucor velutinosus TaxID=708070 RepID=A0AAN7DMI5_9FUNG|nr:hypothetical protein ATC70_009957 [Mucor velutinosus]
MEINKAFFRYILPKAYNTSILSTSLLIYTLKKSHHDTGVFMLGLAIGLFIQALLTGFHASLADALVRYQSEMHFIVSSGLFICSTVLGFGMVKHQEKQKQSSMMTHLATMLTPFLFILNQGIDINLYLIRNTRLTWHAAIFTILTSGFVCILFSAVFFAVACYFPHWIQQCVYSIVVYFTGAIALANMCGYIELIQHPVHMKGLVYTLRQSQKTSLGNIRRLFNAALGIKDTEATNWVGTGYSLYWFSVSFGLIYKRLNHER